MANTHPLQGRPDATALRKKAGAYVRKCREAAHLTQQALAKQLGIEYYTMISQIELGKTRVPPDRLEDWAKALGVDAADFAINLMRYYDPYNYKLVSLALERARSSS